MPQSNHDNAYRLGFLKKLAEYEKAALSDKAKAALTSSWKAQDKANGVVERKPYRNPETFVDTLKYKGNRLLTHAKSTGRGMASALGVAGMRAAQGAVDIATWIPRLADNLVFGKLMGIDEGRGLVGRQFGKFDRFVDSKVHKVRKWSDDYDYANRVGGGFNRFLNGTLADTAGTFIGMGGIGALARKKLLGLAMAGGFSTMESLGDGKLKQLRDREAWLHTLRPSSRAMFDPTSTAWNQENAPTIAEYRRYNMPSPGSIPVSSRGYYRVPTAWRRTAFGGPTQFREYGT